MPRALGPTALRLAAAAFLAAALAAPAPGQTTTIFDSNGFESPYTTGFIAGQQNFTTVPSNATGVIQPVTVLNGTQAFQITGSLMTAPGYSNTGANFWYRNDFNYTPGTSTPFVQVQFAGRRTTTGFTDMPFAGVYVEGMSSLGLQQGILQLLLTSDGKVAVSTNSTLGGQSQTVETATAGEYGPDTWYKLTAEINYTTQSYRVYRQGNPTPLQFQTSGGAMITDVPLRNTFGTTVSVVEIGMLAYNFNIGGGESSPTNNFFIDDFKVTASAQSQAPVPEPGLLLAVGAAGLAGLRAYRRRKVA